MVPLNYYLILGAVVFAIGVLGVIVRRDLIVVLMSIELMLNAVNLTFIAFARFLGSMAGQVAVFFVMAVAAAEAVIGLAIIISVFRHRQTLDPPGMQLLNWQLQPSRLPRNCCDGLRSFRCSRASLILFAHR